MKLFTSGMGQLFALFQALYLRAIRQRRTAQQQSAFGLLHYLNRALRCTDVRSYVSTYNVKLTPFLTAHARRSAGRSVLILASYVLILTTLFVCPAKAQQPAEPGAAQGQSFPNQQQPTSIHQLKIGDAIPDELWNLPLEVANHPNGKKKITLSDYRNSKLLLLDFWATWCVPCITSLQKLDSLQPTYQGDIAILPITYEQSDKAEKFFKGKGWSLPTVTNDSILKAYFPYRSIPQQVWIKEGRVYAITGSSYATATNFNSYLQGEKFYIKMNNDSLYFDAQRPLLVDGNGGGVEQLLYQSIFTKRIDASIGGMSFSDDGKKLMVYNATYPTLVDNAFSDSGGLMDKKRILFEVDHTLKNYITSYNKTQLKETGWNQEYIQWQIENTYCYNLVVPDSMSQGDLKRIMQEDINRFFSRTKGLYAQMEKRKRPVLVLQQRGSTEALKTRGDKREVSKRDAAEYTCKNMPFGYIENYLYHVDQERVFVNEVDFEGNIDISLPKAIDGNLPLARKELARYGLDLVEEEREIEVLVVSQVKS